jgi:uncharacterized protein
MAFRFQWDPAKAEENRRKHGITFEEAASAFADFLSITIPDPEHSVDESRFLLVGLTDQHRLVVVAHDRAGRRYSAHLRPPRDQTRAPQV